MLLGAHGTPNELWTRTHGDVRDEGLLEVVSRVLGGDRGNGLLVDEDIGAWCGVGRLTDAVVQPGLRVFHGLRQRAAAGEGAVLVAVLVQQVVLVGELSLLLMLMLLQLQLVLLYGAAFIFFGFVAAEFQTVAPTLFGFVRGLGRTDL